MHELSNTIYSSINSTLFTNENTSTTPSSNYSFAEQSFLSSIEAELRVLHSNIKATPLEKNLTKSSTGESNETNVWRNQATETITTSTMDTLEVSNVSKIYMCVCVRMCWWLNSLIKQY